MSKNHLIKTLQWLGLMSVLLFGQAAFAQFDIPPKPTKQTSLYDYAKVLTPSQAKSIENKLLQYSDSTSTQIVLITIESLKGESIDLLGPEWGQKWGLGQKGKDNGVIILFSMQDRRIGIYPGYGAESQITAGQGGELIRNRVIPDFKKNDYFAGFNQAIDGIMQMLTGSYKAEKPNKALKQDSDSTVGLVFLGAIVFIIVAVIVKNSDKNNKGGGPKGGNRDRGLGDLASIILLSSLGSGHRSGGSWGSGGGSWGGGDSGGFGGGFGGGGFSGGGSSGSW